MGESLVEDSIILDNCVIGAGCKIRRAILDEGVTIPDGQRIGYDVEEDRRKHHVSESGIVVCSRRIES
jgi:glucose-1-phosphate adenylyltransferase